LALFAAMIATALGPCPAAHAAPKYKVLHNFTGTDGAGPYGGAILDADSHLYGTTAGGGTGDGCNGGCGTVFELAPHPNGDWSETVLHSFTFGSGHDGAIPWANVIFDASGNLYGTTDREPRAVTYDNIDTYRLSRR
jgi:hypothetical protein